MQKLDIKYLSQKRPTAFDIPIPATYPDTRKKHRENKRKKNPSANSRQGPNPTEGGAGAPQPHKREAGASKKPGRKP